MKNEKQFLHSNSLMKENILKEKSYAFAKDIIWCYKNLTDQQKEYILSKQLLRSWTAIWASIREAEFAQSKSDFIHKLSISLKEANETIYRIELLHDTSISINTYDEIKQSCEELIRLLVKSIKTAKS